MVTGGRNVGPTERCLLIGHPARHLSAKRLLQGGGGKIRAVPVVIRQAPDGVQDGLAVGHGLQRLPDGPFFSSPRRGSLTAQGAIV